MQQSYQNKKRLRFAIDLGTGTFGSSKNNRIVLENFRAVVNIEKMGAPSMGTLTAKIFGINRDSIEAITVLNWNPGTVISNKIEVVAIDGMSENLVFAGNITNAYGDYQSPPDIFLNIQAAASFFAALEPTAPRSFKGQVDVASVMKQIAEDIGLIFENNGVNVQLTDVYLANTNYQQAQTLADMAGIQLFIDDKILAITPKYSARVGTVPVINAQSGLIGYPMYDGRGVNFQCLFNPAIDFGGSVKIESDIPRANGTWQVSSLTHRLESEKPDGSWFSIVRGTQLGIVAVSR